MPNQEPDVKFVEKIVVAPAGDDGEVIESPDSSQEETPEEGTEVEKPESEEEPTPEESEEAPEEEEPVAPEPAPSNAAPEIDIPVEKYGEVKRLPGETAREFAYRIEISRLREVNISKQSNEILTPPPAPIKTELSPEKKAVLAKYKEEDLKTLREVFDVMADDMGFVKKDQLGATRYQEQATEVLDNFLEKHPEYQPKNDPGNVLWGRFKEEYSLYRPTQNPRDLKKVLDKVHKEVFGIKPAAAIDKKEAARANVKVASHSGSSRPSASREGERRGANLDGLRIDMLKGFSDEEIAELGA